MASFRGSWQSEMVLAVMWVQLSEVLMWGDGCRINSWSEGYSPLKQQVPLTPVTHCPVTRDLNLQQRHYENLRSVMVQTADKLCVVLPYHADITHTHLHLDKISVLKSYNWDVVSLHKGCPADNFVKLKALLTYSRFHVEVEYGINVFSWVKKSCRIWLLVDWEMAFKYTGCAKL